MRIFWLQYQDNAFIFLKHELKLEKEEEKK
jgi:hypothetical protein